MNSVCNRLLKSIKQEVAYKDIFSDDFVNIAKKIDSYKFINTPVLIGDTSNKSNQLLNIFALLELINVASSNIRIYADKINHSTYGDSLVIQALRGWLVEFPHRTLNILIREKDQQNVNSFYKALIEGGINIDNQISIRLLTKNVDAQFNCTIIDTYAYKIRLNNENNKILLNFNDQGDFSVKMIDVFEKNWKKNTQLICGYRDRSGIHYWTSLNWIDDWIYGNNIPKTKLKLADIRDIIPNTESLDTLGMV